MKFSLDGDCLIDRFDTVEKCLKDRPTTEATQDMIEKEIQYQNELKKVQSSHPEMLELITTISSNYANMDKYEILDTVKSFSQTYTIKHKE